MLIFDTFLVVISSHRFVMTNYFDLIEEFTKPTVVAY